MTRQHFSFDISRSYVLNRRDTAFASIAAVSLLFFFFSSWILRAAAHKPGVLCYACKQTSSRADKLTRFWGPRERDSLTRTFQLGALKIQGSLRSSWFKMTRWKALGPKCAPCTTPRLPEVALEPFGYEKSVYNNCANSAYSHVKIMPFYFAH